MTIIDSPLDSSRDSRAKAQADGARDLRVTNLDVRSDPERHARPRQSSCAAARCVQSAPTFGPGWGSPTVGDGDVLIEIRAAALNRADIVIREGEFAEMQPLPMTLGVEGAGVIVEVGANVSRARVGERVALVPTLVCGNCTACECGEDNYRTSLQVVGEHRDGTCAEYLSVPARNALAAPDSLDFDELAASVVAFMTAWHMLKVRGERLVEKSASVRW